MERVVLAYTYRPYCGQPPNPEALLQRWNLDPLLILCLLAAGLAYAVAAERGDTRPPGWRRACVYAGWSLTGLALVSPLCALSVSLFSARIGQHMILATLAAPLVALGRPWRLLPARLAPTPGGVLRNPLLAAGAFAGALWVWHAPGPYAATFLSETVYWLMHLTLYGSALWLWGALFEAPDERLAPFVAASALTTVQMGLLGAAITFAGQPLYAPHLVTPYAWGLTPLADQQLGGAIMWAPAGVIFVVALVWALYAAMRRPPPAAAGALAREW